MSIFDDTRAQRQHYRDEACYAIDVVEAAHPAVLDAELPTPCGDCRHWGGEPGSAALAACHVSGSFSAPGGFFTEPDFGCIHGTKP